MSLVLVAAIGCMLVGLIALALKAPLLVQLGCFAVAVALAIVDGLETKG